MAKKVDLEKEILEKEMLEVLGYDEFVCLDVETTSFTSKFGDIIEIGAVRIKNGEITEQFSTLVKPRKSKKIPKEITEITGIKTEDVMDKPYIEEVLPKLKDFIGDRPIIGHNVNFDWDKMLTVFFKSIGIVANNRTIDTIKLAKYTLKEKKKGFKLGEVCEYLEIKLDKAHRAVYDAIATAELFLELKRRNEGNYIETRYIESIRSEEAPKLQIKKISYWKKEKPKSKKIEHERLYVNLFYNGKFTSVFLDVQNNIWYVNPKFEIEQTIDMGLIEMNCIKFLRFNTKEELLNYKN